MSATLLPCPFCGGEAGIDRPGTARASMKISCSGCGATVESGDVLGLTKPETFAWNRRAFPWERETLRDAVASAIAAHKGNGYVYGSDYEAADAVLSAIAQSQIASPAGEKIRSAQDEAMETAPVTSDRAVGAVSPFLDSEDRSGECA